MVNTVRERPDATSRAAFLESAAKVADRGLAAGAIACLLIFAMLFYQYNVARERQFSSAMYGVLYYGGPLLAAALLLAGRRLGPRRKVNLFMLCLSLAASVYGLELVLTLGPSAALASNQPVMSRLAASDNKERDARALEETWGVAIDTRTSYEVLAAMAQRGVPAVPILTASNHLFIRQPDGSITAATRIDDREVMPLGAVANSRTLLCNEDGTWVDYQSDERGFRNPPAVWQATPLEIAVLGDSFAHGYCVPTETGMVGLIQQRHPATLNLGMAGNGPLLMLATLKEYLPALRPKIVLWFYFEGNDLENLQTERRSALLMDYLTEGFTQPALARQADVDRAMLAEIPRLQAQEVENRQRFRVNNVQGTLKEFVKLATVRQNLGVVGGMQGDEAQGADVQGGNMDVFGKVLLEAKRQTDSWGGRMLFVYLPGWERYTSAATLGETMRPDVLRIVAATGIELVDVDAAFLAQGDPLSLFPFRRPGHYTPAGHQLTATTVLSALSSH